uniref:Endonuclease/exonuclease/phosphatase domain-containing protein n=1 Tax=Chromera velia CCMP2878 TaxID=1169474 RepID=A0A0K6SAE0_9ALVE|eukprot:Cvel_10250.t1-p1 / transcript=Cvel_10250.t1 / gene=Cvel_10250 / organism=Chromera_velia_CCMP2878 / gene_product=hypothetical protein / transcript_product=hypothetical protein / location=Cvel_scaffold614:37601-41059(+) / protein_length=455 / sequence_SO=supercontig / SO=protein_coding / is_pseudo=false
MIRCHLFYVIAICSLAFQCLAKDLKVATVNTLSQSKCAATPGGIPSMTAEDALAKKTWLTDTLLTAKVKNANLDIVTLQEIDVGESSGKESGKSSHADVKKWAEDNGYTFASSIPSPDYKPDPGSKEDGVVLLLKTATFENPHVCTKLRTGTSKEDRVVVCDGLKVNGAGTLNVFAAHAPSSTFPTEEADPTVWAKLKNAHLILGDMNEESKSFKARIDAKNTKKGYTSEVYPPAGSDTPPNGCVSPAKTGESYEWPLSTTRKDVYKYRKLAQAAENTNVCKYADRICGGDSKNLAEMNKLKDEGKDISAENFDLKTLWQSIHCSDQTCKAVDGSMQSQLTETGGFGQEDLVMVKAPLAFKRGRQSIYPMKIRLMKTTKTKVIKATSPDKEDEVKVEVNYTPVEGKTVNTDDGSAGAQPGMPNRYWPSDHFMITAGHGGEGRSADFEYSPWKLLL